MVKLKKNDAEFPVTGISNSKRVRKRRFQVFKLSPDFLPQRMQSNGWASNS
jgi:hypothetical protein